MALGWTLLVVGLFIYVAEVLLTESVMQYQAQQQQENSRPAPTFQQYRPSRVDESGIVRCFR
jgi:hypothetical protein